MQGQGLTQGQGFPENSSALPSSLQLGSGIWTAKGQSTHNGSILFRNKRPPAQLFFPFRDKSHT